SRATTRRCSRSAGPTPGCTARSSRVRRWTSSWRRSSPAAPTRTRRRRRPARWRSAAEPDHGCRGRRWAHRWSTRQQLVSMQGCEYYSSVTSYRPRRRTLLRAAPLALATGMLAPSLAACTRASERLDAESAAVPVVDLSAIEEVPEIAELVPAAVRERGELVNGAALNYAPGEFVGSTGEAVGYDIDILAAIGAVLGLSTRT